MLPDFINDLKTRGQVYLKVKVRTGATTSDIKEVKDKVIKINLASQPIKGRANKELIELLSRKFFVKKENIEIKAGKNKNYKIILIKRN